MNYYYRYFEHESVVSTPEELIASLSNIPTITMTQELADDIFNFCSAETTYPKHFRVNKKYTFIVIKTTAENLESFKMRGAQGGNGEDAAPQKACPEFDEVQPGWYDITVGFKRMVVNTDTNKSMYVDETFQAKVKGESKADCYDKVMKYLKEHPDVDERSQFPSIRNNNFSCVFVGE